MRLYLPSAYFNSSFSVKSKVMRKRATPSFAEQFLFTLSFNIAPYFLLENLIKKKILIVFRNKAGKSGSPSMKNFSFPLSVEIYSYVKYTPPPSKFSRDSSILAENSVKILVDDSARKIVLSILIIKKYINF